MRMPLLPPLDAAGALAGKKPAAAIPGSKMSHRVKFQCGWFKTLIQWRKFQLFAVKISMNMITKLDTTKKIVWFVSRNSISTKFRRLIVFINIYIRIHSSSCLRSYLWAFWADPVLASFLKCQGQKLYCDGLNGDNQRRQLGKFLYWCC